MYVNDDAFCCLNHGFVANAASRPSFIEVPHESISGFNDERVERKPRVLLYSHDTMGLGHIRRNLLLAQSLITAELDADVLLVTGARECGRFTLPAGADVVVLPALHKGCDGDYAGRHLTLPLDDMITMRSQLVLAAIKSFRPDLVIVDNVVRGINGELDPALRYIRSDGRIRCVLGMRDVRDEPEAVQREWSRQRCIETLRNYYHEVWVYGDARVYDPRSEYGLPADIAAKLRFTGYLDQRARLRGASAKTGADADRSTPFGLCLVGGGQDGAALAMAFADATYPAGMDAIILTGPYMEAGARRHLHHMAALKPQLKVLEFAAEPAELLRDAAFVIAMGGYNTVCEILSFEKPALVVPRVVPRREQLIRAERLQALGVIDMLHPAELTPQHLSAWMGAHSNATSSHACRLLDMQGLTRIPHLAAAHLQSPWPMSAAPLRAVS